MKPEPGWLDQVREDIIEPDRPICDPHHHLWDHPENPYLLPQLLEDLGSGHRVVSTVHVECASMYRADDTAARAPLGETEFVNGVAAMTASGQYGEIRAAAGIVGFADLLLGEAVGEVLDEHLRLSPRFRGVRHACAWDASPEIRVSHVRPPPGLYLRDDFQAGFAELGKRGLSFDAWLYHPQIPELTALARAFPATTIVVDHFGGPLGIGPYAGRQDEIFPQWRRDFRELASCSNVYAKLGGIAMPINGFGFHKQERPPGSDELLAVTGRYYRHALDCFGPERCMFESNFPVDRASCSYAVLWNAFKKLAAPLGAADRDRLFLGTAAQVYRLDQGF